MVELRTVTARKNPPDRHRRAICFFLNHRLDPEITLVLITHDEKDVARWTRQRKQL